MVKLRFIGDIMLGRGVANTFMQLGSGHIVSGITPILNKEYIIIANLEAPFSDQSPYYKGKKEKLSFGINPDMVKVLGDLNVSFVSLANNHMTDCGIEGIETTKAALDSIGVKYCGAGLNKQEAYQMMDISVSPIRIGLMSVCAFGQYVQFATNRDGGVASFNTEYLYNLLKKKTDYDVIILSVHWGIDYYQFPVKGYIEAAQGLVDKVPNLRLVIGHHPHLVQPVIKYRDAIIACSLGNFLFDEPFPLSRIGMILSVEVKQDLSIRYDTQYSFMDEKNQIRMLPKSLRGIEDERINGIYDSMNRFDKEYVAMDDIVIVKEAFHLIEDFSIEKLKMLLSIFRYRKLLMAVLNRGLYFLVRSIKRV